MSTATIPVSATMNHIGRSLCLLDFQHGCQHSLACSRIRFAFDFYDFFWVFPSSGRTRFVLWCRALQTDSTGIGVFLTKGRHKAFVNSSCWNDKGCTFYLYSLCYSNSVWDTLFLSPAVPNSLGKGKNKLKLCRGTWSVQSKSDSLSGIWTLVSKSHHAFLCPLQCTLCFPRPKLAKAYIL